MYEPKVLNDTDLYAIQLLNEDYIKNKKDEIWSTRTIANLLETIHAKDDALAELSEIYDMQYRAHNQLLEIKLQQTEEELELYKDKTPVIGVFNGIMIGITIWALIIVIFFYF